MSRGRRWSVCACVAFMGVTAGVSAAQGGGGVASVELDGFIYRYEKGTSSRGEDVGVVVIERTRDAEVVYRESSILLPGCDATPAISIFRWDGKSAVLLCGSSAGRHQTVRVVRVAGNGVQSASLDYYDSKPVVRVDSNDGEAVTFLVYKDYERAKSPHAFSFFPYAYRLEADQSTTAFVREYGPVARDLYRKHYEWLIAQGEAQLSNNGPAIVASLAAMQDQLYACEELRKITRKDVSRKVIEEWNASVRELKYPELRIANCRL